MKPTSREIAVLTLVDVDAAPSGSGAPAARGDARGSAPDEGGAFADVALRGRLRHTPADIAARATALAFGALRLRNRCDFALAPFLKRPLATLDPSLRAVLRVGAYEILWARQTSVPAAVHDLVAIARRHGHEGLARMANAVLRRIAGDAARLAVPPTDLRGEDRLVHWESHPRWLVRRWIARHGYERAAALCAAGNREPEVCLRPNPLRCDRQRLMAALAEAGVAARPGVLFPEAVRLAHPRAVERLPGYGQGWFAVQDEAAMWVAAASGAEAGMRVIDLAAAPGGKATHLAELMGNEGELVAADVNAARLESVDRAARRLGHSIVVTRAGDARELARELAPADVVLLDAPCSGTGTLARRVDLRWRLSPQRIQDLSRTQAELAAAAAALVKPGGVLVYATCTLEPEENEAIVSGLADARLQPVMHPAAAPPGWDPEHGWAMLWPSLDGHDGAFVALRRRAADYGTAREPTA